MGDEFDKWSVCEKSVWIKNLEYKTYIQSYGMNSFAIYFLFINIKGSLVFSLIYV